MDPFTEKELIDNLKSIASSLRNMDRKMDDIAMSLRELSSESGGDEEEIKEPEGNEETNAEDCGAKN